MPSTSCDEPGCTRPARGRDAQDHTCKQCEAHCMIERYRRQQRFLRL